ncbi:MAG: hypothetical protein JWO92_15 [Chitinophagaceae bacterium]|nr:hypothetical protein [Chitinophagaceae bacterium]
MKKNILSLIVLFIFITIFCFSCSKSSDSTHATATSQWTFEGKTFTVTGAHYESGSNELVANDDPGAVGGGNIIKIFFWSAAKPSGNITLSVVDYATSTPNPSTCSIQVGNLYDATRPTAYLSTGKAGDKVILTISSSGKLTASFSNISVTDYRTTKTVSGTIVEE